MIFCTRSDPYKTFDPPKVEFPHLLPQYAYDIDKSTGKKRVVKCGDTNFYEEIQESTKDCLISSIVEKVMRTGDRTLLGENVATFIDGLSLPRDLLESQQVRMKVEDFFSQLPADFRAKNYGSDIGQFLKTVNDQIKNNQIKSRAQILAEMNKPKEETKND